MTKEEIKEELEKGGLKEKKDQERKEESEDKSIESKFKLAEEYKKGKEKKKISRDIETELKINKYKLDEECENQPNLYYYYADLLAKVQTEEKILKNRLKFFSSKIELEILSTTNEKNVTPEGVKITVSSMNALVTTHETIIKINDDLVKVEKAIYHLEAAVKAFHQRRADLDNLVMLYSRNYFSLPTGRDANTEASMDARKKLNKKEEK